MKKCRITVMRISRYEDLMAQYENPISHACDMEVGQVFVANGWEKPEGFCPSAWDTLSPFVLALSRIFMTAGCKIPGPPCSRATTGSVRSASWWRRWTRTRSEGGTRHV